MFRTDFYHATLRKSIAIFGSLFNGIVISRSDGATRDAQSFKIPISYGPREKFLARTDSDPNLDRAQSISLPRMGFELLSVQYARERKLNTVQALSSSYGIAAANQYNTTFTPVPYDLNFVLSIMVKEAEDGTKILEQILPYFTPDFTISAKFLDDMPDNITDIPIILNQVTSEDSYDGSFINRRALIWTLRFTMKINLYGPIRKRKIIKVATVNLYAGAESTSIEQMINSNTIIESIQTYPGLTANGTPTDDASIAISPYLVEETDDYGYVITVEDYPNA